MRKLLALTFFLALGCSHSAPVSVATEASDDWFACTGRFDCVVVYDAFCKKTAVNSDYALTYQDWSWREVRRVGEGTVCPSPGYMHEAAGCRANRCVYPFGWEDYPKDPSSD